MGLLDSGTSSSGGYQTSSNSGQSMNEGWNQSASQSWSNSWTDAETARQFSAQAAEEAWLRNMYAMQLQMDYNQLEAKKQRDWQTHMANTIYTRSVKNMKEAGINPILAYNMGLSGASVGSGATASLGGVPSAPMAQSFMDSFSQSGSTASSSGHSFGNSFESGSSYGENWMNSEYGIGTALRDIGTLIDDAVTSFQSAGRVKILGEKLDKILQNPGHVMPTDRELRYKMDQFIKELKDKFSGGHGGGHSF